MTPKEKNEIAPHTFVWFAQTDIANLDRGYYFIESQVPGNWQMSQSFGDEGEAMAAYKGGLIVWIDEESET